MPTNDQVSLWLINVGYRSILNTFLLNSEDYIYSTR